MRGRLAGLVAVVVLVTGGSCAQDDPVLRARESVSPSPTIVTPTAGPPQPLSLATTPEGARVVVRSVDGRTVSGTTPYSVTLPGGLTGIEISKAGYEPVTREVDLARPSALTVWLDPNGQLLRSAVRFRTGPSPKQVAYTPDGRQIWSTHLLSSKGVLVYDAGTGAQLGQVKLGKGGGVEVIFTKDGQTAYVSQMETSSVYEIDTATLAVRRQIKTGGAWTKVLALSPDEKTLYASNWSSHDVSEIDLATWQVRRRMKSVETPRGLYPTPDGTGLYVAGFENGDLQRIDLATGKGKTLLRTGGAMRHIVGDGRTLYASDMAEAKIFTVDLATDKIGTLAKTDNNPNTIDLSPDGRLLFVSCRGINGKSYYNPGPEWGSVLVLDTRTGQPLDAIVAGNQTTGLDVSDDGRRVAFSDFLDNRVRVYDIPAYDVLANGGGGRYQAHKAELRK